MDELIKIKRVDVPSEELIKLYEQGYSLCDLVKLKRLAYHTIRNRLIKSGIRIRGIKEAAKLIPHEKRIRYKHILTSELVELYKKGNSLEDIHKIVGLATNTIRTRLRHEIKLRTLRESAKLASKTKQYHLNGNKHPRWKCGKVLTKEGYVRLRYLGNRHYVYEHICVWEKTHNQKVPEGHIIHHLNGIRNDNRPENLVAVTRRDHEHNTLLKLAQQRIKELEILCQMKS